MKKVVELDELTGWKEPDQLTAEEKQAIEEFKQNVNMRFIRRAVIFIVLVITEFFTYKSLIEHNFLDGINDVMVVSAILIATVLCIVEMTCAEMEDYTIRVYFKTQCFRTMECTVHSIDNEIESDKVMGYLHNTLDEYCKTPLEITNDIVDSMKKELDVKVLLLKYGDNIYKVIKA